MPRSSSIPALIAATPSPTSSPGHSRDHSLVGVWERPVHGDASDDLLAGGRRGDERSRGRPFGPPFCLACGPRRSAYCGEAGAGAASGAGAIWW
jgi:hypothetical protein